MTHALCAWCGEPYSLDSLFNLCVVRGKHLRMCKGCVETAQKIMFSPSIEKDRNMGGKRGTKKGGRGC